MPSEPGRHSPPSRTVSWRVCTLEIDRGGYSYTVDTLRQLHIELPEAELFFMIGADAMRDVPQWKEPAEIFRLATPLVVRRAGQPDPDLAAIAPLCTAANAAATDRDAGNRRQQLGNPPPPRRRRGD